METGTRDDAAGRPARIAVVGGGITGLAAALRLRDRAPDGSTITVYEQSGSLGGKLRTGSVAGAPVEFGAEAFLTRDPAGGESAAVALARRLGLGEDLVHPATGQAAIALRGRLLPVPGGTLVGVPGDLEKVSALAQPAADRDRDGGGPLLGPDEDVAVGELVRRRLGDEVVDRLVDPMLGGVYAGRADSLSLATTMPGLARTARIEGTLTGAVRAALAASPRTPADRSSPPWRAGWVGWSRPRPNTWWHPSGPAAVRRSAGSRSGSARRYGSWPPPRPAGGW